MSKDNSFVSENIVDIYFMVFKTMAGIANFSWSAWTVEIFTSDQQMRSLYFCLI